jgi:hypothetical protein
MGFAPASIEWALRATRNAGLQPAMDHLLAHAGETPPAVGDDDDEEQEALADMLGKKGAGAQEEMIVGAGEAKVSRRAGPIRRAAANCGALRQGRKGDGWRAAARVQMLERGTCPAAATAQMPRARSRKPGCGGLRWRRRRRPAVEGFATGCGVDRATNCDAKAPATLASLYLRSLEIFAAGSATLSRGSFATCSLAPPLTLLSSPSSASSAARSSSPPRSPHSTPKRAATPTSRRAPRRSSR